ncbi:VTT domain-containing protein [Dyella sp. 2HG41-7]|uniref:TVP38/TMEM64 family protein n=1 Tax=Dyella sp. 2HG41-7 TaxID=2883239 RepID=UPI001F1E7DBA|nr:VTT domain-containing protein [Dyella sp. 2HG41-7]
MAVLLLTGVLSGRSAFGASGALQLQRFLDSISRAGMSGFLVVLVVLVLIAFTGFLPASLIGVVSGSLYGLFDGFLVSALATLAGAWVSFLVSRGLFRESFERMFIRRARLRRFGDEIVKGGWRFVCLLRMSPIMPFALTSYALGLSGISARNYLLGTVASLPALFGYVCMGSFARHSINAKSINVGYLQWVILGLGVAATIFLTLYVKRVYSRANAVS